MYHGRYNCLLNTQGSYASWKVLEFLLKISRTGKVLEMTLVLEIPGNLLARS